MYAKSWSLYHCMMSTQFGLLKKWFTGRISQVRMICKVFRARLGILNAFSADKAVIKIAQISLRNELIYM